MSSVVIRRTRGRTPTRGKSCARPIPCGKGIFIFSRHAGHRFSPNLCDLVASTFARVRDRSGSGARNHGRSVPFQFIWALSVPRTVLTSLIQPAKQSSGGFTQSLKLLLSRALHAVIKAWSREHEVQRKSASGAQSVE